MEKNVGSADKTVRFVVSAVLVVVGLFAPVGQVLRVLAFIFAATMFVTAITGMCPLYSLIGVSTEKKQQ